MCTIGDDRCFTLFVRDTTHSREHDSVTHDCQHKRSYFYMGSHVSSFVLFVYLWEVVVVVMDGVVSLEKLRMLDQHHSSFFGC